MKVKIPSCTVTVYKQRMSCSLSLGDLSFVVVSPVLDVCPFSVPIKQSYYRVSRSTDSVTIHVYLSCFFGTVQNLYGTRHEDTKPSWSLTVLGGSWRRGDDETTVVKYGVSM